MGSVNKIPDVALRSKERSCLVAMTEHFAQSLAQSLLGRNGL